MSQALLCIDNLRKRFRSHWTFRSIDAVSDISLEVHAGESFGFLGHNGAGKTTTIKCVTGLLQPTSGHILYEGKSSTSSHVRSLLGYLPEQPYFYDHLSVKETLFFFAALHGLSGKERHSRTMEVLERVGLIKRASSSVRSLSKGLQQRLGLAQAIINRPKLLLLDEPFSGLDPLGRVEVRNLLLELKQAGTTIFLSSHILSDISELCDRVAITASGKLKTVFELKDAQKLFGEEYELTIRPKDRQNLEALQAQAVSKNTGFSAHGETTILHYSNYQTATNMLTQALRVGEQVIAFRAAPKSLEEIFLQITEDARKEA